MSNESDMGGKAIGDGLVRVSDAARELAVSPRTIWRMIAEGQLKAIRIRRCTRLLMAEVQKLQNRPVQTRCM